MSQPRSDKRGAIALRHCGRAALVVLALVGALVIVQPQADAQSSDAWQSVVGVTCIVNEFDDTRAGRCNYVGTDMGAVTLGSGGYRALTTWDAGGIFWTVDNTFSGSGSSIYFMDGETGSCVGRLNRIQHAHADSNTYCGVPRPYTWSITVGSANNGVTATIPPAFSTVIDGSGGGGGSTTTTTTSTTTTTRPPGDGGGNTCGAGVVLSYEQALGLIRADGRIEEADDEAIMLAIMTAESGRRVGIISPPNSLPGQPADGSRDHGLMQLNDYWQARFFSDPTRPTTDPQYNVSSAITIFTEWGNWNAWTTYTNGAFLNYIDAATDALLGGPDDPPVGCGDGETGTDDDCDGGFLDIGGKLKCAITSALQMLFVPSRGNVDNVVSSARAYDSKVPFSILTDTAQAAVAIGTDTPSEVAAHRDDCFPILTELPTIGAAAPEGEVEVCAVETEGETSGLRTALGVGIYALFGLHVARVAQRALKS